MRWKKWTKKTVIVKSIPQLHQERLYQLKARLAAGC